jgi:hypothetical protein
VYKAYPDYPLVNFTTLHMAWAFLIGRKRDFHTDAAKLISEIEPPLVVMGTFPSFSDEGSVIIVNHYCRPGFSAMWIGIAISAIIPYPVHWVMTSAWVYPDRFRSITITPLSRWFLRKIAHCYGFTLMPPMPPRPQDLQARASAVRASLRYAKSIPRPIIVIAPEGADNESGCLSTPPKGIGRLLYLFLEHGLGLLPCGLFEENGRLNLTFGDPLKPPIDDLQRQDREQALVFIVMKAIATCLPERLRGPFA